MKLHFPPGSAPSFFGLAFLASALVAGCGTADTPADEATNGGAGGATTTPAYLISNVVFGPEGETAYLNVLEGLGVQEIDSSQAAEFPGWADAWVHEGQIFVASGEAPELQRYELDGSGRLQISGEALSFQAYGDSTVAFWGHLFVGNDKVYWFNTSDREVVVWNSKTMEIERSFPLPELPDRGAQLLAGPTADRSSIVRGNRAYVPFYWADWETGNLSDDSVLLTIDTEIDEVIQTTELPCPEINFATVDDEKTIYLSNWGYSVLPTLLDGHEKACAVRISAGNDAPDEGWRLDFAALTDGREAANLRFLGGRKALLTVFHDERVELTPDVDRYAVTDSANWKLWLVDLDEETASPLEGLGYHAPGLYSTRIGEEFFLSLPSADYSATKTYVVNLDGSAEQRFETSGWLTRLFPIR